MDGFACSSWYFLRFPDPRNDKAPFDREIIDYWLPVDMYVGGAEHAVMHLLYARFWTKVMYDAGLVGFKEPFAVLKNQGMLHAPDGTKMSKSKGNVVTPDKVTGKYGIDTLRMYLLFMAPFEDSVNWSDEAIAGVHRFLHRFYRLFVDETEKFTTEPLEIDFDKLDRDDKSIVRKTHQTIKKVTEDIERLHFNTAISAMMELNNMLIPYKDKYGITPIFTECCRQMLLLITPFAPHLAEEIWSNIGGKYSVHQQNWITYNEVWTKEDSIEIAVQIMGKVRDRFEVPVDIDEEKVKEMALNRDNVKKYIKGKKLVKVIYIKGRLVNIVAK